MADQLKALIKYIEKRDNAKMIESPDGFIMIKKSQNNCKHHKTGLHEFCDSGVNVTCEHWDWAGT